ncbi:divergent polysaccharide deacetylase family protein [Geopsychrobacter electrodiphilus]|uniref:divergent polysaccharide deacetylase family protein n=1 Tax=Geopsychrobacter electrodiphilus TaxID=225196 RepID=UPI000364B870|nr:divergent polysaccharide deacetylase family protein [Geopsychrobacter electrodiphilus]
MASKKKPVKKKAKSRQYFQGHGLMLAIAALVSGALTLAGLIVYFNLKIPPGVTPPAPKIHISTYADVDQLVENELLMSSHSEGWRRLNSPQELVLLQMYGDYPEQIRLMELSTRIALTNSPAQLDLSPRQGIVRVYWQGILRMELRYHVPEEVRQKRPRIAIIMDDMGSNHAVFDALLSVDLPITPAILPLASYATRGAGIMQEKKREYMIHLPMEPKNYPSISPGPDALLVNLTTDEIKQRLQQYIKLVPGAVGGNNHMGSRFTEDRPAMHTVLEGLKAAGLFFVDSRTIGDSVAFDEARLMGLQTAERNIFLDNEENVDYIAKQLHKMVKIAEAKGTAIAICHPYPQTFQALRQNTGWLHEQQVDFVLVSRLVNRY